MDGTVVNRVRKIADVLDGGVLGPGQRVSVLLNLNREMDNTVVGKTDGEDNKDGPAPCADTLQDSLPTVRSLADAAHSGSSGRTRFALLEDAPWRALVLQESVDDAAPPSDDSSCIRRANLGLVRRLLR